MPEAFDLVVDYDAANQACRLKVAALMPTTEKVSNSEEMKRRMYDFLADLVPATMRGKELGTLILGAGGISFLSNECEHFTIIEVQHAVNNTITVTFKDCETRPL